jgi:hypothetical protein
VITGEPRHRETAALVPEGKVEVMLDASLIEWPYLIKSNTGSSFPQFGSGGRSWRAMDMCFIQRTSP